LAESKGWTWADLVLGRHPHSPATGPGTGVRGVFLEGPFSATRFVGVALPALRGSEGGWGKTKRVTKVVRCLLSRRWVARKPGGKRGWGSGLAHRTRDKWGTLLVPILSKNAVALRFERCCAVTELGRGRRLRATSGQVKGPTEGWDHDAGRFGQRSLYSQGSFPPTCSRAEGESCTPRGFISVGVCAGIPCGS